MDHVGQPLVTTDRNGSTHTLTYDVLGRVTRDAVTTLGAGVDGAVRRVDTAYDRTGNRTVAGYATGAGNRLTNDGVWTYTYDAAGQVVKRSRGASAETWVYEYDHTGRQTAARKSATDGGAVTDAVTYTLDAWGNRLQRQQGGTTASTERYAVDGWDTVLPEAVGTENFQTAFDLTGANALAARRVFGTDFDQPLARQDGAGAVRWYLADQQGSVVRLSDNSGNPTATLAFTAFGVVQASSGGGYTQTVTGTDSYQESHAGNSQAGTSSGTLTGGGAWTRTSSGSGSTLSSGSGTNTYTHTTSANELAGKFEQVIVGDTRYQLVQRFEDVSNAGNGGPGHVKFSSHGLPIRDPSKPFTQAELEAAILERDPAVYAWFIHQKNQPYVPMLTEGENKEGKTMDSGNGRLVVRNSDNWWTEEHTWGKNKDGWTEKGGAELENIIIQVSKYDTVDTVADFIVKMARDKNSWSGKSFRFYHGGTPEWSKIVGEQLKELQKDVGDLLIAIYMAPTGDAGAAVELVARIGDGELSWTDLATIAPALKGALGKVTSKVPVPQDKRSIAVINKSGKTKYINRAELDKAIAIGEQLKKTKAEADKAAQAAKAAPPPPRTAELKTTPPPEQPKPKEKLGGTTNTPKKTATGPTPKSIDSTSGWGEAPDLQKKKEVHDKLRKAGLSDDYGADLAEDLDYNDFREEDLMIASESGSGFTPREHAATITKDGKVFVVKGDPLNYSVSPVQMEGMVRFSHTHPGVNNFAPSADDLIFANGQGWKDIDMTIVTRRSDGIAGSMTFSPADRAELLAAIDTTKTGHDRYTTKYLDLMFAKYKSAQVSYHYSAGSMLTDQGIIGREPHDG